MIKEIDIQNSILAYLNAIGIFCWRNNSVGVYDPTKKLFRKPMGKYQINGVSDILGIIKRPINQTNSNGLYASIFLAIEVKSEKGRVSDSQKEFLNNIESRGGVAFVARSIEDVKIKFKEIGIV